MAIESPRLALWETSRTEEALNYVPLADNLSAPGTATIVVDSSHETVLANAVPGTIVALMDRDNQAIATLYALVEVKAEANISNPSPGYPDGKFVYGLPGVDYGFTWIPVDMNWPKIDPNTGRYDDINLINTDPDYVNPSLR